MRKIYLFLLCFCPLFYSSSIFGLGQKGDWIGVGGFGITISPTLVMINPGLEYVYDQDLLFGGSAQMGLGGDGGLLMTVSGTVRGVYGNEKAKIRPTFEGGFGMVMSSGLYNSSVGVHLMAGGGIEYAFDKATSLGTVLRLNFAPPVKGFFISWPLIIGRFRL